MTTTTITAHKNCNKTKCVERDYHDCIMCNCSYCQEQWWLFWIQLEITKWQLNITATADKQEAAKLRNDSVEDRNCKNRWVESFNKDHTGYWCIFRHSFKHYEKKWHTQIVDCCIPTGLGYYTVQRADRNNRRFGSLRVRHLYMTRDGLSRPLRNLYNTLNTLLLHILTSLILKSLQWLCCSGTKDRKV